MVACKYCVHLTRTNILMTTRRIFPLSVLLYSMLFSALGGPRTSHARTAGTLHTQIFADRARPLLESQLRGTKGGCVRKYSTHLHSCVIFLGMRFIFDSFRMTGVIGPFPVIKITLHCNVI